MMDTGFEPSPFTWQASTLSTKPARRTAHHASKLTNKPCPIVKNMYYNKSYLGKTSYSIVSDIGKYAAGGTGCPGSRTDVGRSAVGQHEGLCRVESTAPQEVAHFDAVDHAVAAVPEVEQIEHFLHLCRAPRTAR